MGARARTAAEIRPVRWGRRLFRIALLLLLLGVIGVGVLVKLAVQDRAAVEPGRNVTAADLGRVKQQLLRADPRQAPRGQSQQLPLAARDLQLLLDDASRRVAGGAARVEFQDGVAQVVISAPLERLAQRLPTLNLLRWAGDWINLSTTWQAHPSGLPTLSTLRVGTLPLPASWVEAAARQVMAHQHLEGEWGLLRDAVETVQIRPGQATLGYRWREDFGDRLRAALVPPSEQLRVKAYHQRLHEVLVADRANAAHPVNLSALASPLFELARQRSAASSELAARENKALLLTLALYAMDQRPTRLIPDARHWPIALPREVRLHGRDDFAKHYLISAFIAAEGGGRLADAVGVYKEVADARDGSGFSFNDLAADRAGTRFGQRAANDPMQLQQEVARTGLRDLDLLPDISDLPEFLPEAEFRRQYEKIGSPAYQRMLERIEARVRTVSLLR